MRTLLVLFFLISSAQAQIKVGQWYENIETRERFKVDYVGQLDSILVKYNHAQRVKDIKQFMDYKPYLKTTWVVFRRQLLIAAIEPKETVLADYLLIK